MDMYTLYLLLTVFVLTTLLTIKVGLRLYRLSQEEEVAVPISDIEEIKQFNYTDLKVPETSKN